MFIRDNFGFLSTERGREPASVMITKPFKCWSLPFLQKSSDSIASMINGKAMRREVYWRQLRTFLKALSLSK